MSIVDERTADEQTADETYAEQALDEQDLRGMCARLLAGGGEESDEELLTAQPGLARAITERLGSCGVQLHRSPGQAPLCVISSTSEELTEVSLACLALAVIALGGDAPGPGRRQARLLVSQIWERVGKPRGYTEAYIRRAGLGPLEQRGLVKVVKPDQQASAAYVTAGPALAAIDRDLVARRLRAIRAGDEPC